MKKNNPGARGVSVDPKYPSIKKNTMSEFGSGDGGVGGGGVDKF